MTPFVAKAAAAWGDPPPWVLRLAAEADATSLAQAAARIGYGKPAVSAVLSASYAAGTAKIEAAVIQILGAPLSCPVLGQIDANRCRAEQDQPFRPHAPLARLLRSSCRSCPHRTAPPAERGAT